MTIQKLAKQAKEQGVKKLFSNANRVTDFSIEVGNLYFDYSKTHIQESVLNAYIELAKQQNVTDKRQQLFNGSSINNTEQRAVLHTALRDQGLNHIDYINPNDKQKAQDTQQQFFDLVETVRSQLKVSSPKIKSIIHIGIGGSFLGPKMLSEALGELGQGIALHFISNIDAHELQHVLAQCEPQSTMVVAVSKTFTTLEMLTNLGSVLEWMKASESYMQRVYAVSAATEKAINYGVLKDNVVEFPTWVGGRYSLWSAVSFSVVLLIGTDKFKQLLSGAEKMDQHFLQQPLERNVCFIAAAMDHFYANYFAADTRATFAYDFRLRSFIDYLQQLETESNGKDRDRQGNIVSQKTSPIIWGGVGTDVQHSVFQLLHQGTHVIPAEFILVKNAAHSLDHHQSQLLANGIAQSAALLEGQTLKEVEENEGTQLGEVTKKAKIFSGERPSSTILINELNTETLGMLVAFYEHRTFVYGILCDINSYDQMGVELGKRLAKEVSSLMTGSGEWDADASTKALLEKIKKA